MSAHDKIQHNEIAMQLQKDREMPLEAFAEKQIYFLKIVIMPPGLL